MTRNTIRRVEVAAPVLDDTLRARLDEMFDTMMKDDEKGKELTSMVSPRSRHANTSAASFPISCFAVISEVSSE